MVEETVLDAVQCKFDSYRGHQLNIKIIMISQFLNVKNSTRKLTDLEFESVIETLAEELSDVDFRFDYTEKQLRDDWYKLLTYDTTNKNTASRERTGMKLCEHFFPNFYRIKNSKGECFENFWNKENLAKILRWNRKYHSTPYMSELKRGIYFCCGPTKNTMYRPHLSKIINTHLDVKSVLDPCAGWGGRMLGTIASGNRYIGFEPNVETYENLNKLVDFLYIHDKVLLYNDVAENMNRYDFENVDMVLTSPPYFNLEIYSEDKRQSENKYQTYDEWRTEWLTDVIQKSIMRLNRNGYSCWNVHNVGKMKMIEDVQKIHNLFNFKLTDEFSLLSSKRRSKQKISTSKNSDLTRVFTGN